jgi:hypothetical protein
MKSINTLIYITKTSSMAFICIFAIKFMNTKMVMTTINDVLKIEQKES